MRAATIFGLALLTGGLAGAPAFAVEPWSGFVSVGGSYGAYSFPGSTFPPGLDFEIRDLTANLRGSVARGFAGNWGAQADLLYDYDTLYLKATLLGVTEKGQQSSASADAALHLYYRQPGHWLVGGILQYGSDLDSSDSSDHYFAGLEAQIYCGNWRFYGQAAYAAFDFSGTTIDGVAVAAEVKYFLNPRWSLFSQVSFTRLTEGGDSLDSLVVKAGTERQFGASGWSGFVHYQYDRLGSSGSSNAIVLNGVHAGFRWNFGTGTLKDRDTGGASLAPFDGLAFFRAL